MFKNKTKILTSMTNKTKNHCEICDQTIIGSSYKFKSHLYNVHKTIKPRFECPQCSKKYYRVDEYKRHMSSHIKNAMKTRFACDYCGRSFVDKRNLVYHLKVHDDSFIGRPDIQFKCEACGMFYCENRLLKNHIRKVHYNLQGKEELHLKKPLNETWVEAVNDSKDYVEMTKVNNNIITIRKSVKQESPPNKIKTHDLSPVYIFDQYAKVVCDYCNKQMLKKSLRSHIREKHLNIRKFSCDTCKRTFKRHYQLVDHICGKVRRRRNKKTPNDTDVKDIVKNQLKVDVICNIPSP